MKRLLLIITVALLSCAACSNDKSPEAVAKKAMTALMEGDYKAYAATFDLTEKEQQQLASLLEDKVSASLEEKGGFKSYEIVETTIEEDEATVEIKAVFGNGEEELSDFHFRQVDGEWKQVLDK